jgi:phosphoenolpyruvate carboxylase
VTRQATWLARWLAADLYLREIVSLREELSLTAASDELRAHVGSAHEPYRALLADVRDRLLATRAWAAASLQEEHPPAPPNRPYLEAADLAAPLQLCVRSLESMGNQLVADGRVADVLRRVAAFTQPACSAAELQCTR